MRKSAHGLDAHYRFRIIVNAIQMCEIMEHLAQSLDYSNFKSMIDSLPDQREKLRAYHEVWATMAGLQH